MNTWTEDIASTGYICFILRKRSFLEVIFTPIKELFLILWYPRQYYHQYYLEPRTWLTISKADIEDYIRVHIAISPNTLLLAGINRDIILNKFAKDFPITTGRYNVNLPSESECLAAPIYKKYFCSQCIVILNIEEGIFPRCKNCNKYPLNSCGDVDKATRPRINLQ